MPQVTVNGAFTLVWSAGCIIDTLSQVVGAVCAESDFASTSTQSLNGWSDLIDDFGQSANTLVVNDYTEADGSGTTAVAATC